jgi:phospholipid/cholesterol/gamma-HCH transport system substrate-binding protein
VLRQIAAQRSAFEDALVRAPAVFQQARGTLARVRSALSGPVDQLLGDLAPSAPKAAHLLAQLSPATHNALPAVREINAFLPSAVSALRSLPGVERLATPALASAVKALREALPIVAGLRPYTPDLVAGFFNGFGGTTSGPYDANGHYSRIQEEIGPESLTGLLSALGNPNLPPLNGQRTGLLARCPGAATEASSDGSNPWVPLASLCDPSESK